MAVAYVRHISMWDLLIVYRTIYLLKQEQDMTMAMEVVYQVVKISSKVRIVTLMIVSFKRWKESSKKLKSNSKRQRDQKYSCEEGN